MEEQEGEKERLENEFGMQKYQQDSLSNPNREHQKPALSYERNPESTTQRFILTTASSGQL